MSDFNSSTAVPKAEENFYLPLEIIENKGKYQGGYGGFNPPHSDDRRDGRCRHFN